MSIENPIFNFTDSIATDLTNALPGSSSVTMFQRATMEAVSQ
jgi:hypothetical protein